MAINFTKAIELQVVRKLKSHAKVGYQDHPNGDKQCSGCSMFVEGSQPSCTHVAPPIAAHGYCDDFERIDPNARARAAIAKSFAEVMKDGPPDEPRDDRGRWTIGGASVDSSINSTQKGSLREAEKFLNPGQLNGMHLHLGPVGSKLATLTGHDVKIHPGLFKEHPAKIAAVLVHESIHHGQLDSMPLSLREAQAYAHTAVWADQKLRNTSEGDTDARNSLAATRDYEAKQAARYHDRAIRELSKAYSPDEPRDEKGMWTAGDSPGHPDWMHGEQGAVLAAGMEEVSQGIHDSADHIEEMRQALDDSSQSADDHSLEEDDHQVGTKEYAAWEKQNNINLNDVADKTMALHQALVDHMDATAGVLTQLRGRISTISVENGTRVGKSMSVGDVHAATALGNQPPNKRKARDFLTTIGEVKGGARIVALPTLPAPALDFGKALEKIKADGAATVDFATALAEATWSKIDFAKGRTVNALFMRHGPTKFNNQTDMSKDRVRSWNNVPLTQDGIDDATKAGEKLKDEGIGYIVSSDLGRAIQTSKIVAKAVGIKPIHDYGMRPWNLGKFTGMSTDDAHDGIMHHVENPDETVPEGESFNTFKGRAAQAMLSHIKKAGKKKMLVVSHHRNERLFASMRPDGTVDPKKFMKSGEDPGDFTEMEFSTDELQNAIGDAGKVVEKVWASNAGLPTGVKNTLPGEAQTVWRKVANAYVKAGYGTVGAVTPAWTAVKNGWSKTKDGVWVRKTWLGPDGVHEFLEAELAKLGGESSIEKPTDNVNVSLQLTPLEEDMARSPFPYDQYFFVNLRNDQKERVLAALTDQDPLPERTISLSALSAVQDRVDPAKIQSMMEGAAEKLAVVVRTGPGRYCIIDGHHRLSAALLSGVKTVQVKYLDIEAFDPRVHTDNNPGSSGEPVAKSLDMGIEFDVKKTDEDQQLVFGWASICSMDGVDVVDKQDEIIPEDELEKAAYDFVLYCRQQGDMHERMGVGRTVESMVFTKEKQDAIGVDLGFAGWWVGFKVDDPGVWKRIKAGNLPEFSIGGKARRETVDA